MLPILFPPLDRVGVRTRHFPSQALLSCRLPATSMLFPFISFLLLSRLHVGELSFSLVFVFVFAFAMPFPFSRTDPTPSTSYPPSPSSMHNNSDDIVERRIREAKDRLREAIEELQQRRQRHSRGHHPPCEPADDSFGFLLSTASTSASESSFVPSSSPAATLTLPSSISMSSFSLYLSLSLSLSSYFLFCLCFLHHISFPTFLEFRN
ncbi:hypothetical protein ACLOJK_025882 [Asimina triloba]